MKNITYPRERLMKEGSAALGLSELLQILIESGTSDEPVDELCSRIVKDMDNDIARLVNAVPSDFMAYRGIGEAKACRIAAALEFGRRFATSPARELVDVSNPDKVASLFMGDMRYFEKEVLRVAMLNAKMQLIGKYDVSIGDSSFADASMKNVFRMPIKVGAVAIILTHNHPSGDPKPSSEDKVVTRNLVSAGQLLGIKVIDHIIIGDGTYFSFASESML